MYNFEIKQRFTRINPESKDVFAYTQRSEESFGKDVAEMSRPEILRALSGSENAKADLDTIRSYTVWRQEHGVFPLVNGGCFRVKHNEI